MQKKEKVEDALKYIRRDFPSAITNLILALLIWLFGALVFIPIAGSVDPSGRTSLVCGLIVISSFTLLLVRAISPLKSSIDAFASLLALKYSGRRDLSYDDLTVLFRYTAYITVPLAIVALFWPLLSAIHPALSGLTFILVLIWAFVLLSRIFSILSRTVAEWLKKQQ